MKTNPLKTKESMDTDSYLERKCKEEFILKGNIVILNSNMAERTYELNELGKGLKQELDPAEFLEALKRGLFSLVK